jgi:hypothetical protein
MGNRGMDLHQSRDSNILGKTFRNLTSAYNYKKYLLPRYADKLNIDELRRSSKSFVDFVKALT